MEAELDFDEKHTTLITSEFLYIQYNCLDI